MRASPRPLCFSCSPIEEKATRLSCDSLLEVGRDGRPTFPGLSLGSAGHPHCRAAAVLLTWPGESSPFSAEGRPAELHTLHSLRLHRTTGLPSWDGGGGLLTARTHTHTHTRINQRGDPPPDVRTTAVSHWLPTRVLICSTRERRVVWLHPRGAKCSARRWFAWEGVGWRGCERGYSYCTCCVAKVFPTEMPFSGRSEEGNPLLTSAQICANMCESCSKWRSLKTKLNNVQARFFLHATLNLCQRFLQKHAFAMYKPEYL